MDWLKINESGDIEFNSQEVKLVPEVQALLALNYNKEKGDLDGRKRYRAKREFKYLYLVHSTKSPYKDYFEKERIEEAKTDCQLTSTWVESPELTALIPKFLKGNANRVTQSFNRTIKFLEKFQDHLDKINLNERTEAGAVIHKPKEIMQTLQELPGFLMKLEEMEKQVRNGIVTTPTSKGDHELGWMAMNGDVTKKKTKQTEEDESGEE